MYPVKFTFLALVWCSVASREVRGGLIPGFRFLLLPKKGFKNNQKGWAKHSEFSKASVCTQEVRTGNLGEWEPPTGYGSKVFIKCRQVGKRLRWSPAFDAHLFPSFPDGGYFFCSSHNCPGFGSGERSPGKAAHVSSWSPELLPFCKKSLPQCLLIPGRWWEPHLSKAFSANPAKPNHRCRTQASAYCSVSLRVCNSLLHCHSQAMKSTF